MRGKGELADEIHQRLLNDHVARRQCRLKDVLLLPQVDDQLVWAVGFILLGFFFVILLEFRMRRI